MELAQDKKNNDKQQTSTNKKSTFHGRTVITSPVRSIDETNIVQVLQQCLPSFMANQVQIEYLFNYFKGIQPILEREKVYHKEICNRVVENHAREIVAFKVGYLLWKPIEYVSRKEKGENETLNTFNDFLLDVDKVGLDKATAKHQSICGTSYRLGLQNKKYEINGDEAPFKAYVVNPKHAFVVYSSDFKKEPILGVIEDTVVNEANVPVQRFQCYTDTMFYEIINNVLTKSEPHTFGYIPLIEYPLNEERIGDFEQVIELLDALNTVASNRLDGIEEFIQALMVFKNIDIKEEDVKKLKELGAIKVKDGSKELPADIKYLTQELNQTQVQSLVDYMYSIILRIVGMPSQSDGNTSDSSNNGAVILKNGWQGADARASETEVMFRTSEQKFLKVILKITRELTENKINLKLSDIDIKFTRRNYENLYQKAQTLDLMLNNNKIAPQLAFQVCGLFPNSEEAYTMSKEYYEEIIKNGETTND